MTSVSPTATVILAVLLLAIAGSIRYSFKYRPALAARWRDARGQTEPLTLLIYVVVVIVIVIVLFKVLAHL